VAQTVLYDADCLGREGPDGGLREYTQDKAISNALMTWLSSKPGDFVYQPRVGGILVQLQFKLMSPDRIREATALLKSVISENFGKVIRVTECSVVPDKLTRTNRITINYISLLTNTQNTVIFDTRQVTQPIKEVVNVPYIGDNLMNFILVKLPDYPGILMTQDEVTGLWGWGPYVFTNLVNTDPAFQSYYNVIASNAIQTS